LDFGIFFDGMEQEISSGTETISSFCFHDHVHADF